MNNPWGVTASEAETLDAVIATGGQKAAGRVLAIPATTVAARMKSARDRMKVQGRLLPFILWDRWRRDGVKP